MSNPPPHRFGGAPAPGEAPMARACALLSGWTGLELRGSAPRRVEEFLTMRAEQLGYPSKVAYVDFLATQEPTDPEPQELTNLVTNGLTCFWRDTPQLNALGTVFKKLRDSRVADGQPRTQPINVWCAGCSTGEEAYTVAMIGADQDVPVHVLGSDINTESLRHAHEAVYGEWSLRRTDQAHRERYFNPVAGGRWAISEELSESVEFERHNILSPAPIPPGGGKWDVILCRNVLIYFSDEAMKTVLRLFSDAVDADGYLLLGSSEQLHTGNLAESLVPFRAARQGGGFVYRLRATPPGHTVGFSLRQLQRDPDPIPVPPTLDLNYRPTLEEETSDISFDTTSHEAAGNLLQTAIDHLANQRLEAALACCEATASYDPFVPENYCLMAYMLSREGAYPQALATYRKALFLEPFNWIAAVESARIYMRLQDATRARRSIRQALEGLRTGRQLSRGMRRLAGAMSHAITDRADAEAFCLQYAERLRGDKFLD
jgi:chemotaxis protein methyltransferase CheR